MLAVSSHLVHFQDLGFFYAHDIKQDLKSYEFYFTSSSPLFLWCL